MPRRKRSSHGKHIPPGGTKGRGDAWRAYNSYVNDFANEPAPTQPSTTVYDVVRERLVEAQAVEPPLLGDIALRASQLYLDIRPTVSSEGSMPPSQYAGKLVSDHILGEQPPGVDLGTIRGEVQEGLTVIKSMLHQASIEI